MNHGKKNLRISLVVLDSPLELMDRMAFGGKKILISECTFPSLTATAHQKI
jgi:hypothetical protein